MLKYQYCTTICTVKSITLVVNRYLLRNILVRSYREEKCISLANHESTILPIDDIGQVSVSSYTDESPQDSSTAISSDAIYTATVVGITELQKYVACVKRNRNILAPLESHHIVECSKCDTKQLLTSCPAQYFAKPIVRINRCPKCRQHSWFVELHMPKPILYVKDTEQLCSTQFW